MWVPPSNRIFGRRSVGSATTAEGSWSPADVERISHQPVPTRRGALPQKRTYGSDFPFRDVGQLEGIEPVGPANPSVVSGAYGGFSNIWGAQIMPFSKGTFDRWPITLAEMEPHYRTALGEMTLAGEEDDLAELFPLMAPARRLPPSADRTERVLSRYQAAPCARPVTRHHPRASSAGLQIRRVHSLRPVHDRLPSRAHLLELTDIRPSPDRKADQLSTRNARRPPR